MVFTLLLHLYLFGGRGDHKPGHTVDVRGELAGPKDQIQVVKLGSKCIYPLVAWPRPALPTTASQIKATN